MSFLDKLNKATDKITKKIEDTKDSIVKTYQEKGLEGILDKTDAQIERVGKVVVKAAEKTVDYAKEVGESTNEVVKEAKKETEGKDKLSAIITTGVAATLAATNKITSDLTDVTKKAYSKLIQDENLVETVKTTNEPIIVEKEKAENMDLAKRILKADLMDITVVLKWIGAKEVVGDKSKYVDDKNNTIMIANNAWFCPEKNLSGKGSTSLMAFHLTHFTELKYENPEHKKLLMEEAVNILSQIEEKKTVFENKDENTKKMVKKTTPVKKVAAKKATTKTVAVKKTVAKKVAVKTAKKLKN